MTTNPADPLRHTPPHNLEAEQAVLGGVMLRSSVLAELVDMLAPEDFYYPSHQLIYRAMLELRQASQPVDMSTVAGHLASQAKLGDAKGAPYIAEVASSVISAANATYHAQRVKECAVRRGLIEQAQAVISGAHNPTVPLDDLQGQASAMVIGAQMSEAKRPTRVAEQVPPWLDRLRRMKSGEIQGLKTGYVDLDRYTCGFAPAEFIVIGARPSCGKTALAGNLAYRFAQQGKRVGIFSLEMTTDALINRMACSALKIDGNLLRDPQYISHFDMERIEAWAYHEFSKLPIRIDDRAGLKPSQIVEQARVWMHEEGLDVLIGDYLQYTATEGRHNTRADALAATSARFKQQAKDLGIPIIWLAQLNRDSEKEGRPYTRHIKDCGAIEQDADQIILLHPWKSTAAANDDVPTVKVYVDKSRNSACGVFDLYYVKKHLTFMSASSREDA